MKSEFLKEFFEKFNEFRKTPSTLIKAFNVFKLGMNRLTKTKNKKDKDFIAVVDQIMEELQTLPSMNEVTLNPELTSAAEKEVKKYSEKYPHYQEGRKLKGIVSDEYLEENPCLIMDKGADSGERVITKVIANKNDKQHLGKIAFFNAQYTQIGLAHRVVEEDDVICIILANNVASQVAEIPEGDLSELKKAFDLYDVHETQHLQMEELMRELKEIKFNETNPVLYDILEGLSNQNKVASWPAFATYCHERMSQRKTEEGLKDIFDIFVDEPNGKAITYDKLNAVNEYLKLGHSSEELHKMLGTMRNMGEINFEDFCDLMKIEQ